jgi:general secretion pathway protein K
LYNSRDHQRGFALLIVLWTLVLIAFVVGHVTTAGRTEIRIAGNLMANAAAQAAATGAIYQAVFNLTDPRPDRQWPLDGTPHQFTIGGSRIAVAVRNEAMWINPNLSSVALLEGLLRASGTDQRMANEIALAIAEWVGSVRVFKTPETMFYEYRSAGFNYGPPRSPFESIDELGLVRGVTPMLLERLRPHLTLFGPAQPDPKSTDPVVAAAIEFAMTTADAPTIAGPSSETTTVRIAAVARGPANAEIGRTAVVRIGPINDEGYTFLAWDNDVH